MQNEELTEAIRKMLIAECAKQWETAQNLAADYEKQAYIVFSVGISLLSFAYTAVNSLKGDRGLTVALLWVLIAGAVMIMAWVSTLFRRQALAEHNAIRLEKRLNELLGEDVYLWQSRYMEEYGIDREVTGLPNKTVQITSWVLIGILTLVCLLTMVTLLLGTDRFPWIESPVTSWGPFVCAVVYVCWSLFQLVKSFQNDKIRHGKSGNLPKGND